MKKTYNSMIVLLVVLMLFLAGCGTKTTDVSTTNTTNDNQEVTSTAAETSSDDNTPEVSKEETSGNIETTAPVTTNEPGTTEPAQTESKETTTTSTTRVTTIPTTETPASNTLKIKGKVKYEMVVTLDELKSLDDIIVEEDFSSKNNFGTVEQNNFKGVNLWYLLKNYAGIDAGASSVTVIAIDGYKMTFTINQVMKQDYINESEPDKQLPIIIAWQENGTDYDPEVGPPYQLVVGQIGPGDFNKFQWVRNIDSIIVE
jgi:DMSO/TMAO reductase YedYZ molybdopterin-dependent catalytic subunit